VAEDQATFLSSALAITLAYCNCKRLLSTSCLVPAQVPLLSGSQPDLGESTKRGGLFFLQEPGTMFGPTAWWPSPRRHVYNAVFSVAILTAAMTCIGLWPTRLFEPSPLFGFRWGAGGAGSNLQAWILHDFLFVIVLFTNHNGFFCEAEVLSSLGRPELRTLKYTADIRSLTDHYIDCVI
jgi:hypothetical protein